MKTCAPDNSTTTNSDLIHEHFVQIGCAETTFRSSLCRDKEKSNCPIMMLPACFLMFVWIDKDRARACPPMLFHAKKHGPRQTCDESKQTKRLKVQSFPLVNKLVPQRQLWISSDSFRWRNI